MKHKILSFLTAFAMVFGIIAAPFVNASAADEAKDEVTEKVTLHKLIMNKDDLQAWDSDKIQEDGYDGSQKHRSIKSFIRKRSQCS